MLEEVLEQQKLLSDRVAAELRAVSCGVGALVLVGRSASVLCRLTTAHLNVRYPCTPVAHPPVNASSVLSSKQQQQQYWQQTAAERQQTAGQAAFSLELLQLCCVLLLAGPGLLAAGAQGVC